MVKTGAGVYAGTNGPEQKKKDGGGGRGKNSSNQQPNTQSHQEGNEATKEESGRLERAQIQGGPVGLRGW